MGLPHQATTGSSPHRRSDVSSASPTLGRLTPIEFETIMTTAATQAA